MLTFVNLIKGITLLSISLAAGCSYMNEAKEEAAREQLISRHIKHALYKNDVVPTSGYFNVTAQKGVVTLSGLADNKDQMSDALAIAKRTQGVIRVENQIIVKGSPEYYSSMNKE